MRVGIVTHPKVIQIAEALSFDRRYQDWSGLSGFVASYGGTEAEVEDEVNQAIRTTRYVTVTALLRFWGYANEHAKDDFVSSLRIADIDEIVQIPGFGAALQSVGWVVYDKDRKGTLLPNFAEHNATASDRTNAARQKRYRERHKNNAVTSNVTRDVTVIDREEKRREEKVNTLSGRPDSKPQAVEVLSYLNEKTGRDYQPVDANIRLILGRIKDGSSVDDCKAVIDRKCADWLKDDKMSDYLRPATLFNATKFAQYRGEIGSKPQSVRADL